MISLDLEDDDILELSDSEDRLELAVGEVQFDLLPSVRNQIDCCRACASRHPDDLLSLDTDYDEFHFWYAKYNRDGNIKALEMAYLISQANKSSVDGNGLMWKSMTHPEFPGQVMPAEIIGWAGNVVRLLIRLPVPDNPRVRTNVKGGAHKRFRVVEFNTKTNLPVSRTEKFEATRFAVNC